MPTATPARRARARRDPAVLLPPKPPRTERDPANLELDVNGVRYGLGARLDAEADQTIELTMDGASTVTLTAHDPDLALLRALDTEDMLLVGGARIRIDGIVYVLTAVSGDDDKRLTLTFTDYVAWVLGLFTRYLAVSRSKSTAAEFVLRLADEARKPPLAGFGVFIPELTDKQRIARAEERQGLRGEVTKEQGLGDATIRVKHVRATAFQRDTLDGCLREAARLGASRRVMIAVVMCITQESRAGADTHMTGNDDVGIYQQGRNWISAAGARQPAAATRAFLITGPTSWKKVHGSIRNAPGNLDAAIKRVQGSIGGYAQWEAEATKTVDAWLGGGEGGGSVTVTRTYAKSYLFTRGERNGERETSWQAIERIASDRDWRRWAALNTLHYASEPELRAAMPSLTLDGTEGFVVSGPNWDWGSVDRPITEVEYVVIAERWGVLPGAVVVLEDQGPLDGRWLVSTIRDPLIGEETQVTLTRPTPPNPEPAHETATSTYTTGAVTTTEDLDLRVASGSTAGKVYAKAVEISRRGYPYVWGGGHAHAGRPDGGTGRDPGTGFDCSGYVAACLAAADLGFRPGSPVPASGTLAASWGRPGRGKHITLWANGEHVWLEFHGIGRYSRADTSPHGDGPSGARVRSSKRTDQARFTARHWPGV